MTYIKPCYGGMNQDTSPHHTATSYTEVSGATIASGTVVDTRTTNQTYLQVQEDQQFDIQFTFTGLTSHLTKCDFVGRYEGNVAHDVFLYQWNYTLTQWDRTTSASQDFVSSATDVPLEFNLLTGSDYVSGGEAKLRIYHSSAANPTHDMYIDYIAVTIESISLTLAGTAYQVGGFVTTAAEDVTVDATNGSLTINKTGVYNSTASFSIGAVSSNSPIIQLDLYINGVSSITLWTRRLNDNGDVGNASSEAIRSFSAGDVITYRLISDTDDTSIIIYQARCSVIKIN